MRFSIILLVSLVAAGPVSAGVVITMEQAGGLEGGTRQQQVFVEPGRLKLPQGKGGIIYRADQEKAYNYDDERKTYTEMSRESLGQMRQQMDAALAQVRQQMANMPPDQRKMVEEMLAKQGAGAMGQPGVPTVTFEKSGGRQTVGKWSCEGYARLENGRKTQDLCIARIADVGLTSDDLKAFTSMSAMLKSGLGRDQGTTMDFDAMSKAIGFEGVPVRSVIYLPNGRQHESTMKSVERRSLPPATFELPVGYTRQEMPRPPGR